MGRVKLKNGMTIDTSDKDFAWYSNVGGGIDESASAPQAAQPAPAPAPAAGTAGSGNQYPFQTMLDESGNLLSNFQIKKAGNVGFSSSLSDLDKRLSGIQLDKRGLEALRERGLSTGDSSWAKLMLEKQAMEEQDQLGKAVRENASSRAGAIGSLARSGGASSGARERLAAGGARDLDMARQDVGRSGMMARLGIRSDDENKRLDVLKMLPGAEVQSLQPELQKTSMWGQLADSENARRQNLDIANRAYSTEVDKLNIGNTLGVKQNEDAARLKKYEEDMKAYAADQSAKAQAASGGGGKK